MAQKQNTLSRQSYSAAVSRLPGNFTVPVSYDIAYSYRCDKPDPLMANIPQNIENLQTNKSSPSPITNQLQRT